MPPEHQVFLCKFVGMCLALTQSKSGLTAAKLAYVFGPSCLRCVLPCSAVALKAAPFLTGRKTRSRCLPCN